MKNNILENIWIDSNIFKNGIVGGITNTHKIYGLDSAYKIWEEANNTILNCGKNVEKLNQGFLSLKRAFNVTSVELKKNLAIDKIRYSSKKKNKDFLGDLEHFEIIKTLTLNKYLNLRNLIEHENQSPPSVKDCLSLSEYIWNYIRNTANILKQFTEYTTFTSNNRDNKILFEYSTEKKKGIYFPHLHVTALIRSNFISFQCEENYFDIGKIRLLNKFDMQEKIEFEREANCIDDLNHIAFEGEILDQDIIAMYIKYLILPEYGGLDETSMQSIFSRI